MKKIQKTMIFLPILALVISGCDGTTITSTSEVTTSDDPTTTTTSTSSSTVSVEDVLAILQANPQTYSGVLQEVDGDGTVTLSYGIEGYISDDRYIANIYYNDVLYYNYDFSASENGYVQYEYLDPFTNTVAGYEYTDYYFGVSMCYNPWVYVDASMASADESSVTFTFDSTIGQILAEQLTMFTVYFTSATVSVSSTGGIEEVVLSTGTLYDSDYDVYYEDTFTFTYCELEDIYVPDGVTPRTKTSDHDALQSVFDSLKAGNYTISYEEINFFGGYYYDTYTADVYYTEDVIYVDEGDDAWGAQNVTGGWQYFDVVDGSYVAASDVYEGTVQSYWLPPFTILAEMFDYVGDNTYVYANAGTEYYLLYTMPDFFVALGYPDEGTYTWTINSDGTVDVEYTYSTYAQASDGYYYEDIYIVEFTISDIGNTTVPTTSTGEDDGGGDEGGTSGDVTYPETTTWANATYISTDVNDVTAALTEIFGENYNDILPCLADGRWGFGDYGSGSYNLNAQGLTSDDIDGAYALYESTLTAAGFTETDTNTYVSADGTVTVTIYSMQMSMSSYAIFIDITVSEPSVTYPDTVAWSSGGYIGTDAATVTAALEEIFGSNYDDVLPCLDDVNYGFSSSDGTYTLDGQTISEDEVDSVYALYESTLTAAGFTETDTNTYVSADGTVTVTISTISNGNPLAPAYSVIISITVTSASA